MDAKTSKIIKKLIQAKALEKEAFMMLLPDKTKKHLDIISHEVKKMIIECLTDVADSPCDKEKDRNTEGENSSSSKVRKIKLD